METVGQLYMEIICLSVCHRPNKGVHTLCHIYVQADIGSVNNCLHAHELKVQTHMHIELVTLIRFAKLPILLISHKISTS